MRKISSLFIAVILLLPFHTTAGLIDRGNGMIYDEEQDITWISNANLLSSQMVLSNGSLSDEILNFYDQDNDGVSTWTDPKTGRQYNLTNSFGSSGIVNWASANAWANWLTYGGFDDWRLVGANPSCGAGPNCLGNELGYLFYEHFNLDTGDNLANNNLNLFTNIQTTHFGDTFSVPYWTNTIVDAYTYDYYGWFFKATGYQSFINKNNSGLAWAVRDGDISNSANPNNNLTPVPEPNSLFLFFPFIAVLLYKNSSLRTNNAQTVLT